MVMIAVIVHALVLFHQSRDFPSSRVVGNRLKQSLNEYARPKVQRPKLNISTSPLPLPPADVK